MFESMILRPRKFLFAATLAFYVGSAGFSQPEQTIMVGDFRDSSQSLQVNVHQIRP
jgi:hypothetical protein